MKRTYKKNDQAHVEEKNGSVVRRLVGYDRHEGVEAWRALSGLYRALRLYVNFFQPSLKLLSKQRDGGRVTKRYDRAQTPYQRVLASGAIAEERKEELRQRYNELDPVALLGEMERLQDQLWQHAWNRAPVRESTCVRSEAVQEPAPRSSEATEVALPRPSRPKPSNQCHGCTERRRRSQCRTRGGRAWIPFLRYGGRFGFNYRSIRAKRRGSSLRRCRRSIPVSSPMDSCGRCSGG